MKISFQQHYYSVSNKKFQKPNSTEVAKTLSVPQNNVNFRSLDTMTISTTILAIALGTGTIVCIKNAIENFIKSKQLPKVEDNQAKKSALKEPISDIDSFEGVSNIKIITLPMPSIREMGFAGFMYKGEPYTASFLNNNKSSLKIGILEKLKKLNPNNKHYYANQIHNLQIEDDEKNDVSFEYPVSDVGSFRGIKEGLRSYKFENNKILQLANPAENKPGYVAFVHCGQDYVVKFSENSQEAVKEAIYNKIYSN